MRQITRVILHTSLSNTSLSFDCAWSAIRVQVIVKKIPALRTLRVLVRDDKGFLTECHPGS